MAHDHDRGHSYGHRHAHHHGLSHGHSHGVVNYNRAFAIGAGLNLAFVVIETHFSDCSRISQPNIRPSTRL